VCLRILTLLRIPRLDLRRQTPAFSGGSVTSPIQTTTTGTPPSTSTLLLCRVDLLSLQYNYQWLLVLSIRTKLCYNNIVVYEPCTIEPTSSLGQSGKYMLKPLTGKRYHHPSKPGQKCVLPISEDIDYPYRFPDNGKAEHVWDVLQGGSSSGTMASSIGQREKQTRLT
jgi:hypothetical protein